jgi:hypothetical protein
MTYECVVPIAEWAGSGTVNLAQNDVEFASVAGTWDDDSTTTVYGPAGSILGGTLNATRIKTITWQTPIQVGDKFEVEMSTDRVTWLPAVGGRFGASNIGVLNMMNATGSFLSGIHTQPNGVTSTKIIFWQYANAASDDSPSENWPNDAYWRVRKTSAGAAVGFGTVVPGTSAGLVSASGLPGNTTGNAIASGYVGQIVGTERAGTDGKSYSVRSTDPITQTGTAILQQSLNKGVYVLGYNLNGYASSTAVDAIKHSVRIDGTAVTQEDFTSWGNSVRMSTGKAGIPIVITADSTIVDVYVYCVAGAGTTSANLHEMWIYRIA